MKFCVALLVLSFSVLAADPGELAATLERRGKRNEANACFQKLTASNSAAARAEGLWGLRDYKGANDQFKVAVAQQPTNADLRVRWGRLFFERFNPPEAQTLFKEALEIQPKHAGATLGIALDRLRRLRSSRRSNSPSRRWNSIRIWSKRRNFSPSLLWKIATKPKAIEVADKAMKMSPDALDAMAVRLAIDLLEDKKSSEWEGRINAINPVYGDAWSLAGHILVLNRRYEEGIAAYKKALATRSRLAVGARPTRHEPDAARRREGSARAP